jgi:hypothetical protein
LNLIEGTNVTLTVADDGVDDEVDITIASSGGAGGFGAWTDYSATSIITGWSSFVIKQIFYAVSGDVVIVNWSLSGTSNNSDTHFSLPHNVETTMANYEV